MSSKQHKTWTACVLFTGCSEVMLFAHSHFHFAFVWERVKQVLYFYASRNKILAEHIVFVLPSFLLSVTLLLRFLIAPSTLYRSLSYLACRYLAWTSTFWWGLRSLGSRSLRLIIYFFRWLLTHRLTKRIIGEHTSVSLTFLFLIWL